jgi:hypothetical protein
VNILTRTTNEQSVDNTFECFRTLVYANEIIVVTNRAVTQDTKTPADCL